MNAPETATPDADRIALAVDGGGSKTDVVAIAVDGTVLAHARGSGSNAQSIGWPAAFAVLDGLRHDVVKGIDARRIATTHVYLSGLDFPAEIEAGRRALSSWTATGGPDVLENDLFALLRAGTLASDAVAVVCGTGINALGIRADGATARFPALGEVSGDWGGGSYLGSRALWHAARAADGRGPGTALVDLLPPAFGLETVAEVIEALHFGRIEPGAVNLLAPVLFAAAEAGDAVSLSIVDRQAEEIAIMIRSCIDRLALAVQALPIVLGGGVLAARPRILLDGVFERLSAFAPHARPTIVAAPPILGAGLSALEDLGASPDALRRYRTQIEERDFVPSVDTWREGSSVPGG